MVEMDGMLTVHHRAVRQFQKKGNTVAKLVRVVTRWHLGSPFRLLADLLQFAKHIKIEESTQFLKTHRTGIAVGTPKRLGDLVENGSCPFSSLLIPIKPCSNPFLTHVVGSLSLENLERLVVDASHIDQKKRGVLDMKDTMLELSRWLARREFKERYTADEKPLQLLFY